MQMVVICEKYGWTYEQFKEQPTFFIDLITEKMRVDAQRAENQANK